MDIKKMFMYFVDEEDISGIVYAENEESAAEKVRAAYKDHYGPDAHPENWEIRIEPIGKNSWFSDHPDVLEITLGGN